jgi:pre-mRNA-splicing factor 38A
MANIKTPRTVSAVHGVDPQLLVEKIIRERIYESAFYRGSCDTLDFDALHKVATTLNYIGGTFANTKPVPFICILLKLLQIQPSPENVDKLIHDSNKYVVALGLFYARLVRDAKTCYSRIEGFLLDYRKLRHRQLDGTFTLMHFDEFADNLLRLDRFCGIILPRIAKRKFLEETGMLDKVSMKT